MKNSDIITKLEAQNEAIWKLIRSIHEGELVDLTVIKSNLINLTGDLNTEILIPLQRLEED